MIKLIFPFSLFMLFNFTKLFSQDILLHDFKSKEFELKYPEKWKVDTIGNKYSFYYDTRLGDITVSINESREFTNRELTQMLLGLNDKKEDSPDVQLSNSNGTIICQYQFTSDKIKYIIKAVQNGKKMYLISLNWNEDSWDSFKDVLLKSFNSFKPK